jgi:hypothetical protein
LGSSPDRGPEEAQDGFVTVTDLHDHAINTGLRHLGVHKAPDAIDESATVGLGPGYGGHCHTDDWV